MHLADSIRTRRIITALAIALTLAPAATQAREGRGARRFGNVSIPNFGQINDGYFRGSQPKGDDYSSLASIGVKMVIDLTRDGEAAENDLVQHAGMKFVRIPLTTSAAPPAVAVSQFLALVNDPVNQPVYVHCQGGRHRTGIMTALYRVTHDGWSADRAFAEMKEYEFEKGFVAHNALKNFLYDFYSKLSAPSSF
jgi:protein tyrosine/serine phosphatase